MNAGVARVFAGAADAALTVSERETVVMRQHGMCFHCGAGLWQRDRL